MMETKKTNSHERDQIKRKALEKLDKLLEAELKRLHDFSPKKPILEQFKIIPDHGYFSPEELEEIKGNIASYNMLSSSDMNERTKAIHYIKNVLTIKSFEWPWKDNE